MSLQATEIEMISISTMYMDMFTIRTMDMDGYIHHPKSNFRIIPNELSVGKVCKYPTGAVQYSIIYCIRLTRRPGAPLFASALFRRPHSALSMPGNNCVVRYITWHYMALHMTGRAGELSIHAFLIPHSSFLILYPER